MPLDDGKFTSDLTAAFSQVDWGECSAKLSKAIQDYVKSGTVETTVVVIHIPVPPAPALPGPAKGKEGEIIAITSSGLTDAIIEALKGDDFQTSAEQMADAIDAYTKGCTILISQYDPPFVGLGVGPPSSTGLMPIVPVGLEALKAILTMAFKFSVDWSMVTPLFMNGVKTYITTCIVNTVDLGFVPLASWMGIGIGTIS